MAEKVITEEQSIESLLEKLIQNCSYCKSAKDEKLIRKAFKMANDAHKGMRRKSGEPYIIHPLEVAIIVSVAWGMLVIALISYRLAVSRGDSPLRVISEHVAIACVVVMLTHWVGDWVAVAFSQSA